MLTLLPIVDISTLFELPVSYCVLDASHDFVAEFFSDGTIGRREST